MSEIHVEFKSNLKEVKNLTEEALRRGLRDAGMEAVSLTHRDKDEGGTPVITGRLRNSMAYAVSGEQPSLGSLSGDRQRRTYSDDNGENKSTYNGNVPSAKQGGQILLYVGTNVEYAEKVEEGSINKKGAHMLRNAVNDIAPRAEQLISASLKAALDTK